jgi:hypothetical protein
MVLNIRLAAAFDNMQDWEKIQKKVGDASSTKSCIRNDDSAF